MCCVFFLDNFLSPLLSIRSKMALMAAKVRGSSVFVLSLLVFSVFCFSNTISFTRDELLNIWQNTSLKWENHIHSIVKKAQQRLYFLRQLRNYNLPQELLKKLYSAIIESVLCTSITVWFSSATKFDLRRLQRVVQTAERIIGIPFPTLQ